MYIIVGLGNPGRRYAGTRHNIGFSAITALAEAHDISVDTKKHKAKIGTGVINGEKVILVQPLTYMNLSGECVKELVDYYKIDVTTELIIIYDDVDLDVGRLRVRAQGRAGGHNGIKNIVAQLGTQVFTRIRVGVGKKPEGWDLANHVLAKIPDEEQPAIREALQQTVQACELIIQKDVKAAMNRFNQAPAASEKE